MKLTRRGKIVFTLIYIIALVAFCLFVNQWVIYPA